MASEVKWQVKAGFLRQAVSRSLRLQQSVDEVVDGARSAGNADGMESAAVGLRAMLDDLKRTDADVASVLTNVSHYADGLDAHAKEMRDG